MLLFGETCFWENIEHHQIILKEEQMVNELCELYILYYMNVELFQ